MAIVGEAAVIVRAITTGFNDDINKALNGINGRGAGANLSKQFNRGFNSGPVTKSLRQIQNEADRAREAFFRLVTTGYFVGPAISGLVGAIGALAAGFVALSSQILAATPALIVLPSIFSAIGQAALTAKLAFGGLGKAVQSIGKSTGGSAKNLEGNFERIRNAKKRVENATTSLQRAQDRLNQAYETAAENLQQLNFDAEDAAIAEKKAAIELEKARETLARVQDLPPNSRARREAELAYAEADLNLRRAVDRNKDLAAETEKRNAAGVEGSEEVVSAQEAVKDATEQQFEAVRELAKAQKALNDAQKGGGAGAQNPFEGLSEEAIAFAKYLASLKPKIQELRAAAGRFLFPQLETGIQNLVDNLFPRLIPILEQTGRALGKSAIDFSNVVTEAGNLENLNVIAATNTDTIGKLGTVSGNLYSIFTDLLAAADPLIRRFTDWVVTLTDGWKNTIEAKKQTGELTDMFNEAGDVAAQLGRIFGNIGRALMDIGRAASGPGSGGQMLLDSFEGATKKFEDFVTRISEDGSLEQYFRDVVTNVEAIGRLFNEIVVQVLKLGDDKGIAGFADGLTRATESLGNIFGVLNNAGPALGTFIDNLVRFFETLAESKSIELFFGTLNVALEGLILLFSNSVINRLFMAATAFLGIVKAIMLMNKVAAFGGRVVLGYVQAFERLFLMGPGSMGALTQSFKLARAQGATFGGALKTVGKDALFLFKNSKLAAAATKVWTGIQAAFSSVMLANPIVLVTIAIAALVAAVVAAYFKFEWFRNFVDGVFRAIKDVIMGVINWVKKNWPLLLAILLGPFGILITGIIKNFDKIKAALMAVWDVIAPVILTPFKLAWEAIKIAIDLVSGAFDVVKTTLQTVWDYINPVILLPFKVAIEAIKIAIDLIGTAFGVAKDLMQKAWTGVIRPIIFNPFKAAVDGVKAAIDLIGTAFNLLKEGMLVAWGIIQRIVVTPFQLAVDAVKKVVDKVKEAFDGVREGFEKAWGFISDLLDKFKKKLDDLLGPLDDIIGGIGKIGGAIGGGLKSGFKAITPFAEGGFVSRPTMSLIGEAGPELVIPLSAARTNRRNDLLQQAGLANSGTTINMIVNPSPGMDEVELASLVSRQIAFQLRRGTT